MHTAKLGRTKEHRERTLRNLLTSLFLYEAVSTTEAKAKAIRAQAERLIHRSRKGTLDARRQAKAVLFDMNAVAKLFEDLSSRWGERQSGYTRITKLPSRNGDGAPMARLELLVTPLEEVIAAESKAKVKVRKSTKKAVAEPKEPAAADTVAEPAGATVSSSDEETV